MFEQMMFVNTSPQLLKGLDVSSAYGCLHSGMKPIHGEPVIVCGQCSNWCLSKCVKGGNLIGIFSEV